MARAAGIAVLLAGIALLGGPARADQQLAGDAERGEAAFEKTCSACHTIHAGGRRRVGPNLFGIVGAQVAQRRDYPYSPAMRRADFAWTEENLIDFLEEPWRVVPGTKMDFAVPDQQLAADIVAFMRRHR